MITNAGRLDVQRVLCSFLEVDEYEVVLESDTTDSPSVTTLRRRTVNAR